MENSQNFMLEHRRAKKKPDADRIKAVGGVATDAFVHGS